MRSERAWFIVVAGLALCLLPVAAKAEAPACCTVQACADIFADQLFKNYIYVSPKQKKPLPLLIAREKQLRDGGYCANQKVTGQAPPSCEALRALAGGGFHNEQFYNAVKARGGCVETPCQCAPPEPPPAPAPAATEITWDGACTPSQVGARGSVKITKVANGDGFDVTLDGKLTISSATYGYVRHGLPSGFLPVSTDPASYTCELQQHADKGDTSAVGNYGGQGVHVRNDTYQGYQGRATLWFPEKFYNGEFTLRCKWKSSEATDPSAWQGCAGIQVAP